MRPSLTAQRKAKADATPEEAEIAELSKLVRACGGRVKQKEIAELDSAGAIKVLNKQLDDLGMPKRRSQAAADKIKAAKMVRQPSRCRS